MAFNIKYKLPRLSLSIAILTLVLLFQLPAQHVFAQDKAATIKLSFTGNDTTKICRATVTSSDSSLPVKGTEIHLYAKRMYSVLAIGKPVATDDNGVADISFPKDLPGDKDNMITVIAKIENDDNYANTETEAAVKWGVPSKSEANLFGNRSLSASREKAPMLLIVASSMIILLIWGTIFYVIFQLPKIKKSANPSNKLNAA